MSRYVGSRRALLHDLAGSSRSSSSFLTRNVSAVKVFSIMSSLSLKIVLKPSSSPRSLSIFTISSLLSLRSARVRRTRNLGGHRGGGPGFPDSHGQGEDSHWGWQPLSRGLRTHREGPREVHDRSPLGVPKSLSSFFEGLARTEIALRDH